MMLPLTSTVACWASHWRRTSIRATNAGSVCWPPGATTGSLILARAANPRQRSAIGDQFGGRVGLFLQTDNFARDHKKMLSAGVTFEESPRSEPYGTVAVWRDPFGNRWDLIEFREHD